MTARYYPEIFDAADMKAAKEIILTPEGPQADTETRWRLETPYVLELIGKALVLAPGSVVLDYGCGVGRMAKAMIEASGCFVIGVDISAKMRRLAPDYVESDRFVAVSPAQFDVMVAKGLRVDAAIAIWVLQHCLAPAEDIARIRRGLAQEGSAMVLNMPKRAIPAAVRGADNAEHFAWGADRIDVAALLRDAFAVAAEGAADPTRTPNMADVGAFWMSLRQRPA